MSLCFPCYEIHFTEKLIFYFYSFYLLLFKGIISAKTHITVTPITIILWH